MGFKENFIGVGDRYNYGSMCAPNNPFRPVSEAKKANFYGKGKSVALLGFYTRVLHDDGLWL